MIEIKNYINGRMATPVSGAYLDVYNPAEGKVYAISPDSNQEDVNKAFEAASGAFEAWSKTSGEKRFKILNKIAELIDRDREKLAAEESRDQGKPYHIAIGEMIRAAQNFRFFATAAMHFASESHANEHSINYTLRQPYGVVACISPWNLPLYLFTWKIAPALATGNCVIAKPSEITPFTAFSLSELCIEAGLPEGVLNIVHGTGPGVGSHLVSHPDIPVISFTGGTRTGAQIASVAAPMFKKLSLELGGKNPNLIFADCDFDKTVESAVRSSFLNQGEICLCTSRIYVHKDIYESFKSAFVAKTKALKVGDPSNPETNLGAIVSEAHYEKILSYIESARAQNGQILCGGSSRKPEGTLAGGWYIDPTIIEGLPADCNINQEEIFGPVVTIQSFDTDEEALALANSTPYGLQATIWTNDLTRAHNLSSQLKFGIIWINCWLERDLRTPFGGTKASGVGREGGWEAMRFFTEPKNVCISLKR